MNAIKKLALTQVNPVLGRVAYFALGFAVCFTLVAYQVL